MENVLFFLFFFVNMAVAIICLWKLVAINHFQLSDRLKNENNMRFVVTTPTTTPTLLELNYGSVSDSAIQSALFGSLQSYNFRSPVVMIRTRLDHFVHQSFLQHPMFSCNQSMLDTFDILDRRVIEPVYIYEGYFHSLPTNESIFSRNPNPKIGVDFMKPPADKFIRSFYHAFRQINSAIFDHLKLNLLQSALSRSPDDPSKDACYIFAKWIERGLLFGDLSIQIHYGKGNDDKFAQAWHTDAENSLLHLAVTLRGRRILHTRRSTSEASSSVAAEILEPQSPGDVYLSSSTLMMHAPKFPTTSYSERTIAIHARILYTSAEVNGLRSAASPAAWKVLAAHSYNFYIYIYIYFIICKVALFISHCNEVVCRRP